MLEVSFAGDVLAAMLISIVANVIFDGLDCLNTQTFRPISKAG